MIIVLIPAYNEENNIPKLLNEIDAALTGADLEYRCIVVNDGSTDKTGEILDDFSKKMPIDVVHHEKNMNLGGAMKTGLSRVLETCDGEDLLITMDADNSHPPKEILRIYERLLDGPDIVVASRYFKGGEEKGVPIHRIFLSKVANWLFKFLFPIHGISDYTGSFRGMRIKAITKAWNEKGASVLNEQGFTVMPEILLCLRGHKLVCTEIPLILRYDLKGDPSKMRVFENIKGTLSLMARMFFGGLFGSKR